MCFSCVNVLFICTELIKQWELVTKHDTKTKKLGLLAICHSLFVCLCTGPLSILLSHFFSLEFVGPREDCATHYYEKRLNLDWVWSCGYYRILSDMSIEWCDQRATCIWLYVNVLMTFYFQNEIKQTTAFLSFKEASKCYVNASIIDDLRKYGFQANTISCSVLGTYLLPLCQ